MKRAHNIATSFICSFFVVLFVAAGGTGLFFPARTEAQTIEELRTQIEAFLEEVNALQVQLAALQGGTEEALEIQFTRNLRIGDRGEDVRALQKFLNTDSRTRLAESGSGSPGTETDYFGPLTETAVIAFQNLYAAEILAPYPELTSGTGFVGPTTRAKLNSFRNASVSDGATRERRDVLTRPTGTTPGFELFLTRSSGAPGDEVDIFSEMITESGNTVVLGEARIPDVPEARENIITFTVPDIALGMKTLYIENASGVSSPVLFAVSARDPRAPYIVSVSPEKGRAGTVVTITGENFTAANTVHAPPDVFEDVVSSDGTTLALALVSTIEDAIIDPIADDPDLAGLGREHLLEQQFEIPVTVAVQNQNGKSNLVQFTLIIGGVMP